MHALNTLEIACAVVSAIALVVAVVAFFVAAKRRAAIDIALRGASNAGRLGFFDLARASAMRSLERKYFAIPERLWTYDSFYLEEFSRAAHAAQMTNGQTALDSYLGPAMGADIVFAAALGLFVTLFEFDLATILLQECPLLSDAVLLFACMGAIYGAADVAEDLKLTSILKDWRRTIDSGTVRHVHIDGGEAAAANALTRIKIVAITFSIVGAALFAILSALAALIYRSPHDGIATGTGRVTGAQG